MSAITQLTLIKGLDGLSLRQIATVNNVANANSPGFVPSRVTFEDALAAAAKAASRGDSNGFARLAAVRPQVQPDPKSLVGDSLRVDLEMATSTQTAMRYGALVDVLDRQLQLTGLSITGGR